METQLEQYAELEVLRAILDQGCDPKEYGRQYETRLRQAELESIQDYLAESDNLVLLHEQARPWTALVRWWWRGLLQASLVPTGAARTPADKQL